MRDGWVEADGLRLHYVEQGTRSPPVLLLHGFPEFWYAWNGLLPGLAAERRAIALDLPGYNLSGPAPDYRAPAVAGQVRAFAAALGLERLVLAGHDWGGVVAWVAAALHPEVVERLVIVNAPHPAIFAREYRENPAQREASAYFDVLRSPDAESVLARDGFSPLRRALGSWASVEDVARYVECWERGLTGALGYYRALGAPAELPPVEAPTLVIWGERDTALLTGNLDGLEEHAGDLTVRRVPDGSHWVIHEQPALVLEAIREFLA